MVARVALQQLDGSTRVMLTRQTFSNRRHAHEPACSTSLLTLRLPEDERWEYSFGCHWFARE